MLEKYKHIVFQFFTVPRNQIISGFFGLLLLIVLFQLGFILPPHPKTADAVIAIQKGDSAEVVIDKLDEIGALRSPTLFSGYLRLTGNADELFAGRFIFSEGMSARKIVNTLQRPALTDRVTIVPGWDVNRMGMYFEEREFFSADEFVKAAAPYEGYLYPDTYEVFSGITAEEVVALMRTTFAERLKELEGVSERQDVEDVIILASIIEREAAGDEDRHLISGILWKRLETDYPLQVDATLTYVTGKGSAELSVDDLQTIDSPYNTYQNIGLPPTPIGNPSLAAIEAAINPTDSPYWFYLHGSDRSVYFARTFEEHKQNKFRYLR